MRNPNVYEIVLAIAMAYLTFMTIIGITQLRDDIIELKQQVEILTNQPPVGE